MEATGEILPHENLDARYCLHPEQKPCLDDGHDYRCSAHLEWSLPEWFYPEAARPQVVSAAQCTVVSALAPCYRV